MARTSFMFDSFSPLRIRPQTRRSLLGLSLLALLAGCSPEINHRGYYPKAGALAQVAEGMPKTEVEGILGSPSTTASVNFQGDSYYYITSVTQGRSFLEPKEIKREVIAVRFDKQDQVTSVAQYGLEDGRVINLNDRTTPVPGSEFNILRELLRRNPNAKGGGGTIRDRL
jgi:outer membrane protein assembly factor BamE (lipoprotein component of BamABCDE complex)